MSNLRLSNENVVSAQQVSNGPTKSRSIKCLAEALLFFLAGNGRYSTVRFACVELGKSEETGSAIGLGAD